MARWWCLNVSGMRYTSWPEKAAGTAANEEVAETLMDLLPPMGWADVATKRDLDHLEARLGAALQAELRRHTYWIMTSLWSAVGVAVGLSQAL